MSCAGTEPTPMPLSPRPPVGPRRPAPPPGQGCQRLPAQRLFSFDSGRFPDFPVVDVFVVCALDTLLRAMSRAVS